MSPGSTSQPSESGHARDAGGDRDAHAERVAAVGADLGQDDDVARRDAAARDVDERRGRDDDGAQMAGDRTGEGLRQHGRIAERLGELVVAGTETRASASGEDHHRRLGCHAARMKDQHRFRKWEVYVRPSPNGRARCKACAGTGRRSYTRADDRHRRAAQELRAGGARRSVLGSRPDAAVRALARAGGRRRKCRSRTR